MTGWFNEKFDGLRRRENLEPAKLISPVRARAEQVKELERRDHRPLVILSRQVLEKIKAMRNGLEDAGWLVGPRGQEGSRVLEAHRSLWPAMDEDRAPRRVQVWPAEADQINEAVRSGNQAVVGHWHVQPDNSLPSDADIACWRSLRRDLGRDSFVGVVVKERLTGPVDVRAYVVDRDDAYQVARIEWRS